MIFVLFRISVLLVLNYLLIYGSKYICFIFGEISLNSQKLLDKLIEGCQEKDPAIRLNAVEALGLKK